MSSIQNRSSAKAADAPESLLSTADVAAWLGIRRCTLEKARSTRVGDFPPFIRVGRTVRYSRAAVTAWLNRCTYNVDGSQSPAGKAGNL